VGIAGRRGAFIAKMGVALTKEVEDSRSCLAWGERTVPWLVPAKGFDRMCRFFLFLGVVTMISFGGLFGGWGAYAADIPSVDALTLEAQMSGQNPPLVLDVREPMETSFGTIQGATLIPLSSLESRLSELPKDRLIAVYCRSGNRSLRAASILKGNGFTLIENLSGGMNAWTSKCASSKTFC